MGTAYRVKTCQREKKEPQQQIMQKVRQKAKIEFHAISGIRSILKKQIVHKSL
jgi:hypothetical protein